MSKKSLINKPPAQMPESFEAAMTELSSLVNQMETGNLPLEASVGAYQRGSELIQFCAAQLERVEQQVKVLEAGNLKPLSIDSSGADA